eukprot:1146268-Pelagomonas_calceolata.AAC.1
MKQVSKASNSSNAGGPTDSEEDGEEQAQQLLRKRRSSSSELMEVPVKEWGGVGWGAGSPEFRGSRVCSPVMVTCVYLIQCMDLFGSLHVAIECSSRLLDQTVHRTLSYRVDSLEFEKYGGNG